MLSVIYFNPHSIDEVKVTMLNIEGVYLCIFRSWRGFTGYALGCSAREAYRLAHADYRSVRNTSLRMENDWHRMFHEIQCLRANLDS